MSRAGAIDVGQSNLSTTVAFRSVQPEPDGGMMTCTELTTARPVVLVIDDDLAVRNSLKFALEIEGFCVRVYPSGAELLDETDMPDRGCLVADYHLQGMNGLELLAA